MWQRHAEHDHFFFFPFLFYYNPFPRSSFSQQRSYLEIERLFHPGSWKKTLSHRWNRPSQYVWRRPAERFLHQTRNARGNNSIVSDSRRDGRGRVHLVRMNHGDIPQSPSLCPLKQLLLIFKKNQHISSWKKKNKKKHVWLRAQAQPVSFPIKHLVSFEEKHGSDVLLKGTAGP